MLEPFNVNYYAALADLSHDMGLEHAHKFYNTHIDLIRNTNIKDYDRIALHKAVCFLNNAYGYSRTRHTIDAMTDYSRYEVALNILEGRILKNIEVNRECNRIKFTTIDDYTYDMYHEQDCCESVTIEDVTGDLDDLIGDVIMLAETVTNMEENRDYDIHMTWTFYKLRTRKGDVTLRIIKWLLQ